MTTINTLYKLEYDATFKSIARLVWTAEQKDRPGAFDRLAAQMGVSERMRDYIARADSFTDPRGRYARNLLRTYLWMTCRLWTYYPTDWAIENASKLSYPEFAVRLFGACFAADDLDLVSKYPDHLNRQDRAERERDAARASENPRYYTRATENLLESVVRCLEENDAEYSSALKYADA